MIRPFWLINERQCKSNLLNSIIMIIFETIIRRLKTSLSMKKIISTLLCCLLLLPSINAQRVGLVLSGGGAKGLTHIGVIRALEENGIPIDYITGTSMGAIIGSLYSMGYSPDDMVKLLSSDEFTRWYTGQVEPDYIYFFKKNKPTPEFISFRMSIKDSIRVKPQLLTTSVVDPIQMNLAFLQLFAQTNAYSRGDFNNLFVPFRCIASDVYNKEAMVLRNGDLGDAVRASMSFPFVFKPIEIDGILAYDGGIYNNFPVDVMLEDFKPDFILGSVVARNPDAPQQDNLMSQIDNMVMQKTDYTMADSLGIVLNFRYDDVSLMDMHRIGELDKIGYDKTIATLDSIKGRVSRRVAPENITLKRMVYKSNLPELRFRNIYIEGANPQQQSFIKKEFNQTNDDYFSFEDLKRAYFRLLSGNMISEIIPHAEYDPIDKFYDLYLKVKLEDNILLRIGGNISTANSNQIYLGATYQDLNYYAKEFSFDGQLGKVYNSAQLMAKIDLPTKIPSSYRLIASMSSFDYFKNDKILSKKYDPAFNSNDEYFFKAKVALPFLSSKRAEFGVGAAKLRDKFFQTTIIDFKNDSPDKTTYSLFGGSVGVVSNTLNNKQYATDGFNETLIAQIFTGKEHFTPGSSSTQIREKQNHSWLQLAYRREQYHSLSDNFILGWEGDALYSSRNFSSNYTATMMQAGTFAPTPHSKLLYNEAFRANQYIAGGVKPIWKIGTLLHLRTEFYGFLPIFPIKKTEEHQAYYGRSFSTVEFLAETTLVFHLPFGAVSAYVSYYSSPRKEWNVGLSIGWQLFNYRFIE